MPALPLTLRVDEVSVLPQVDDAVAVLHSRSSCFAELLRHSAEPAHLLFPDAASDHGGEVPPPRWWSEVRAHVSDLHLFKIRDALVLPASGVVVAANGDAMRLTMEEALYGSDDLTHLDAVARRGGRSVLDVPNDAPFLPAAIVAMPHGAVGNYGHFLLDAMASLAAIDVTGQFAGWPVVVPPLRPWQERHLALYGRVPTVVDAPVLRVGEVIYTSAMNHFLHRPNVNYRDLRARQIAGGATPPQTSGQRRLYLARRSGSARVMASERRLVARLRRAGFDAVDPAALTVDRQIALFAEAEAVVGTSGAAFANVLYCRPGTLVVEIQPEGMENHWVLPLCQIMGLHHAAYFCRTQAADPLHPEHDLRFDVDVERLLDFAFRFAPLSGSRPSPTLLDRLAGMRRRGMHRLRD